MKGSPARPNPGKGRLPRRKPTAWPEPIRRCVAPRPDSNGSRSESDTDRLHAGGRMPNRPEPRGSRPLVLRVVLVPRLDRPLLPGRRGKLPARPSLLVSVAASPRPQECEDDGDQHEICKCHREERLHRCPPTPASGLQNRRCDRRDPGAGGNREDYPSLVQRPRWGAMGGSAGRTGEVASNAGSGQASVTFRGHGVGRRAVHRFGE